MIGVGGRGATAATMMSAAMAMKCKKHPYEQGVGVCASCLRERLLELVDAQSARAQQQHQGVAGHQQLQRQHSSSGATAQQIPPPLVFPRSVSPYVSRRRSVDVDCTGEGDCDAGRRRRPLQFFSTPQVGPGVGRWKSVRGGFLASLFGRGHHSRSEEVEPEFVDPGASRRSGSWFSALLPGRGKNKQQKKKKKETNLSRFFEEAAMAEDEDGGRRSAWRRDRDFGGGEDDSPSESGYSTESGGYRMPTPTPMRKHASSAHRTMSGLVVCLSPLVRTNPRRSQSGEGDGAPRLSGELRGARASSLPCHFHHHRHGPGAGGPPVLAPNRSRKLADLGRFR